MGKLEFRRFFILKILWLPINLIVSIVLWAIFRISFKEAWTGEIQQPPTKKK